MQTVFGYFWEIYFKSLQVGKSNASIADQISAKFTNVIKEIIRVKTSN
jgi:hypothetical protein